MSKKYCVLNAGLDLSVQPASFPCLKGEQAGALSINR